MHVLWLCNIILPDFSQEFGVRKNNLGGWMTGMLHGMEQEEGVDVSLCFPIYDKCRLKDGNCGGHFYYTFLCDIRKETYDEEMIRAFETILERSRPDIVHIWGTEYPHTLAMLLACENMGILDRAVVNIQGLVSVYAKHYMSGIPEDYITLKDKKGNSIQEGMNLFERRGVYEIRSIQKARHVIGRTDWDRACAEAVHPGIQYHFCDEIIRPLFYEYAGSWSYDKCRKHSIFVSQAFYPVKGFHFLLQAIPIVMEKYPNIQVYVAGENIFNEEEKGSYAVYLENLMDKLDVKTAVSFLGRLDERQMIEQYQNANVFVSASSVENESNSLSEARIVGTPSVSSYVGGAYQRITSGEDGYLYPYDEPALLAYYICRLFENQGNICEKFSVRSVERIMDITAPKKNTKRNMAIYKEILKG